ncbi:MAG: DUF2199 domain-containing protein [Bacteroidetes bacterium]|nr:MAG: DUF2199 domain-containing protein [Bacteroidota bacterium]
MRRIVWYCQSKKSHKLEDKKQLTCSICGQIHEEWPALAFNSPTPYDGLSPEEKNEMAQLRDDFCIISYADQTDKFIRATLTIKVNDYRENLEYGIWVSLNEKSFIDYSENFNNPNHEAMYFGWLSNDIPHYEFTDVSIPTTVFTRQNGLRPEVVPHKDFDHQLVRDYNEGITKGEAERRIHNMLNEIRETNTKDSTK